jgi:hypothetical protein
MTMQDQHKQSGGVRQQDPCDRKNCGESTWESTDDKPHATSDVRHEGVTWFRIDPPCQSTGTKSNTVGSQASRGRDPHRDKGRVIMIIRAATGKKDGRDHHYGQAMIGRTRSQQEKINKRKDNRNSHKQKERNNRGYHRYKGRERKNPCEVRYRLSNQQRSCDRPSGMVRMKRTHRKRNPLGKEVPNSPRRVSRMEQATKDAEGTFQTLVAPKGKATITRWEKEIKEKHKGKAWDALAQEADWVTDLGATQPRETLYHKTMEMAWLTKMMIDKVSSEMEEARQEDNKEHKKMLDEILSRLSSLETITKLLVEVEKDQKSKMERLAAQFHLYLRYVHHMDITPADGHGAPTHIRKTRTISQKEDNKSQADDGKKHIIVLD